jgi:hypothetical protein
MSLATKYIWWDLAILLCVAFCIRVYDLTTLPILHLDEVGISISIRKALAGDLPIFSVGYLGSHPTLESWVRASVIFILGDSFFNFRLVSVLVGTLCVGLLYMITSMHWGRIAGLAAGYMCAAANIHIQWSRYAMNNIDTAFASLGCVGLALCRQSIPNSLFLGFAIGASQYAGPHSRITAAALLPVTVCTRAWKHTALIWATALAVFFPLYWYAPSVLTARMETSILYPSGVAHVLGVPAESVTLGPFLHALWYNTSHTIQSLFLHDSYSTGWDEGPLFDWATLCFFGVGVIGLLATRTRQGLSVLWVGAFWVLAIILSVNAPATCRVIILLPALICLVSGVGWEMSTRWMKSSLRAAMTAGFVCGVLYFNVPAYFSKADTVDAFPHIALLPTVLQHLDDHIYIFDVHSINTDHFVIHAPNTKITQLTAPKVLSYEFYPGSLLVAPRQHPVFRTLMQRYPNAILTNIDTRFAYTTLYIPRS